MIEIIFVESNIETLELNVKELEDKGEANYFLETILF